jgi:uncharacterized repeat protein (TIGR01451 family)
MFNRSSPTSIRQNRVARVGAVIARCASLLLLVGSATQVHAQFKVTQSFTGTSASGWTLTGNAFLTAPSIDPVGSGWLRLTAAANLEKGVALYTGGSFAGAQPLIMKFNYVSWGGTGADGIGLFLYDSTQDMSGAQNGGGLGYCQGAGGYLGIGLDEYGNFSTGNSCTSGGPGFSPDSLVIRGPIGTGNPYVTGIAVPGGVDVPGVSTRPPARTVLVTLMPQGAGFSVSAQYQPASGQPYQTLFSGVSFPYTPPASLSVGISGSTGGSTNVHEVQGLTVSSPDDLQVVMTGPANIAPGNAVNYQITVTNDGPTAISLADSPTITDDLDSTLQGVSWTCVASVGAACSSSGTGALDDSSLSLPVNGTATYMVSSTLSPTASCGGQITSSATGDFGPTSRFTDYNPSNNTSSVSTTINCSGLTLMGNPSSLSFSPQGVGTSSQPLTVTLSGNGGPVVAAVSASGDFSETNNCPTTALVGSATCTIVVTFKPTAEGSRSGALTITSDAPSSPLSIALSGVGTSTTPDPFSFTALHGVDPSTREVSNAITVEGNNVSSPISISGGTYSINGGPFTAAPGYVSPGAHVVVSVESSSSYLTATAAQLTIGGVAATFTVTTRAVMPGALSFGSAAYTASGSATSAPVTITRTGGTDGTVAFDIVNASGAVIGHGIFAAGVGDVQTIDIPLSNDAAGAVLPLRIEDITGGATPGTIAAATLTVTAAPLSGLVVRSGGMGAVSPFMLLMLGLLTVMRFARRRWCWMLAAASLALVQVHGSQAAETDSWWSNLSVGARLGVTTSSLTNTEVSDELARAGFDVASNVSRSATAKSFLLDYALPKNLGVDFAWGYLGNTRTSLSGTTPANLNALLNDAAYDTRGSGSDVSLSLRYRWILPAAWSLEARGGGYRWRTDTRVWLGPVLALERVDRGIGYTLGLGPRYQPTRAVGVSVNFDYFSSTTDNRFWQETIGADFRF